MKWKVQSFYYQKSNYSSSCFRYNLVFTKNNEKERALLTETSAEAFVWVLSAGLVISVDRVLWLKLILWQRALTGGRTQHFLHPPITSYEIFYTTGKSSFYLLCLVSKVGAICSVLSEDVALAGFPCDAFRSIKWLQKFVVITVFVIKNCQKSIMDYYFYYY